MKGKTGKELEAKVQKLYACHQNQLETLSIFASGIVSLCSLSFVPILCEGAMITYWCVFFGIA